MKNKETKVDKNIKEKHEEGLEEMPIYQEVEIEEKEVRTDSYFDGSVLELIGWKILAFIIIYATLGLGTPWAQCMLYAWQFKHTVYNGKRLKFEGDGGDLFVNIFKWIFFTIITFGIYAFFIPVKKAKWVISNIHYEDEDYNKDETFFDGNTLQLIGINILSKIITVGTFGLLYPFTVCFRLNWINKHTVINKKELVFDGNGFQLIGRYILWCFLTIITFGIFAFWIPISMCKWQTKHVHIKTIGEEEREDYSLIILILIAVLLVLIGTLLLRNLVPIVNKIDFEEVKSKLFDKLVEIKEDPNKFLELCKKYDEIEEEKNTEEYDIKSNSIELKLDHK